MRATLARRCGPKRVWLGVAASAALALAAGIGSATIPDRARGAPARAPAAETIAYVACTRYREGDGEVTCMRRALHVRILTFGGLLE